MANEGMGITPLAVFSEHHALVLNGMEPAVGFVRWDQREEGAFKAMTSRPLLGPEPVCLSSYMRHV